MRFIASSVVAMLPAALLVASASAQQLVIDSPIRATSPNDSSPFTSVSIDLESFRNFCTDDSTLVRNFPIGRGQTVDLVLQPFDIFTPDAQVLVGTEKGDIDVSRPDIVLLRGHVAGDESTRVFLGLSPTISHGYIVMNNRTYFLSSGPFNVGLPTVIYDSADLPPDAQPRFLPCGTDDLPQFGGQINVETPPTPRGEFTCRSARIAVDTVWEHTRDLFNGDTHAAATYDAILMAAISEIYVRDLNLHLAVPFLRVWASNVDPYDVAANDVLGQFRNHWANNMGAVNRTLAHIFTTEGLNGAGGVAWLGVVCNNTYGYGASGYLGGSFPYPLTDYSGNNWDLVVTAHELGHNFGGNHTHSLNPPVDGCGNGDCSAPFGGTILSYCHTCSGGLGNIQLHFHERNLAEMNAHMANNPGCQLVNQSYPSGDYATTLQAAPILIDVLSNDNIGSCGTWAISNFATVSQFGGTIARSIGTGPGGRDQLLYTPRADFSGSDRFNYAVSIVGVPVQTASVSVRVVQARPAVTVANPQPGADASYYVLAQPSVLPNFDALTPYRSVTVPSVNYPSTNGNFANSLRADEVGAVFRGFINIPTGGYYNLSVESDDGSRLFLGTDLIIDNDGLHGMVDRSARVALAAGMHPIRVEFFENGGGAGCIVRWQSDTIARQPIPANRWFRGVLCTVDWDASGAVNSQDFFDFLADFFAGNADYNNSGATNSQDLFDFISAFFAGC